MTDKINLGQDRIGLRNVTAGPTAKIAVLASGSGSNLQSLLDHFAALGPAANGQVVLVISNKADAYALDRARQVGIPALHIDHRNPEALLATLRGNGIDLVVLAGYLKLIPEAVISEFRGRMINVHPGPIPRFGGAGMYGIRVHSAVVEAGLRESEVTIHFVDERYDEGAVICKWPVPVLLNDSPEELAARVLRVEHIVFPRIIDSLCAVFNSGLANS